MGNSSNSIRDDKEVLNNQILMYMSALMNYNLLLTDLSKEAESLLRFTRESYNID